MDDSHYMPRITPGSLYNKFATGLVVGAVGFFQIYTCHVKDGTKLVDSVVLSITLSLVDNIRSIFLTVFIR